ncbi:MAG: type III-B CRISPR-associated protein Cas10/Cmr2 [Nitrospinae bacterium]|nr:type III-B CRISPR-associated protein Cas10/Cmr2 [Nitrospinota bacterium]
MDDKLLIKKIQALLHDPPEKPIILGKIGHEGRAKEIMGGIIDEAKIPDDVRTADHIASAADRINLDKYERFIADFRRQPVIMHPLSAKEFDLQSLAQVDIKDITATVDRAIVHLSDKYQNDTEKLYLALWRELVHNLMDKENDMARLGQLWELLPADTRVPDHSIWEHKRVTSAIAGALPKPAFLLFAIGPVQEFIATARKTQDLWAGSYLLSYLSWSAMKVVAEEFGPDSLIFPDLCGQPFADKWLIDKGLQIEKPKSEEISSPTLPNRFLAIVPEGSVREIAEKTKQAVKGTFKEVCNAVKTKMVEVLKLTDSSEWDAIWNRQTEDFIETYWAAVPVNNYNDFLEVYKPLMGLTSVTDFDKLLNEYQTKGFEPNIGTVYGQIYRLVEKTLGSRKTVRDFKQTDEPNHKCTLCGVREPVHPGKHKDKSCSDDFGALRGFWQESILPAFPQIRKSERLCAVCVSKRLAASHFFREKLHYDISNAFPSVSMIATASFKEKIIKNLGNPELYMRVNEFINHLGELFKDNKDRMKGESVPMVRRMCSNEETVNTSNKDLALSFASLEGDWLYEDSFRDSLKDELTNFSEDALGNARKSLHNLIKVAKKLGIDPPSKYYSILLMDGDNMGKWLSGEYAPKIGEVLHPIVRNTLDVDHNWQELLKQKRPLNPSLHLATSKALRDFSLHVAREIVEKDHLGKLVYAGGDDVLAFVNLRDLPEVMRKLRAYFSGSLVANEVTNKVDINFKEGKGFVPVDENGIPLNVGNNEKQIKGFMLSMGTNATASMGVVIAHHNSNLSQVLDEVRRCEKVAKKKTGFPLNDCGNDSTMEDKNAFCIALAKRAGGTEHISAKWYYDNIPTFDKGGQGGIFESIPLLRQWADAFYNGWMSPKMVYTFRTETNGLEGLPEKAIKLELMRIADRQRNKKTEGFDKEAMKNLVDGLVNLHRYGLSLDDIGKFLSLAVFLGREGNR